MESASRASQVALVLAFLGCIAFPLLAGGFSWGRQTQDMVQRTENRSIAPPPVLNMRRYRTVKRLPATLEAYLRDRLPFRLDVITGYSAWLRRMGRHGARGVFGREGWLFFNDPTGRTVDDYLGNMVPGEPALAAHLRRLDDRRRYFAARGIRYYLLLAPNKVTIYPEYLPEPLWLAAGVTYRQAFMRHYREQIALYDLPDFIIDPTDALRTAKDDGESLYYPQDTHWSWRGRLVAASMLCDRLRQDFPELGQLPRPAMRQGTPPADLAGILSVPRDESAGRKFSFPEAVTWEHLDIKTDGQPGWPGLEMPGWRLVEYRNDAAGNRLWLHLVGDSFFLSYLPPPEALVFGTVHYEQNTKHAMDPYFDAFPHDAPDIIVEEIVERNFPFRLPSLP